MQPVKIVRPGVSLIARFIIDCSQSVSFLRIPSRIRSKTTIVSFDRITSDRQHRANDNQRQLATKQSKCADRQNHVMQQGNDRSQRKRKFKSTSTILIGGKASASSSTIVVCFTIVATVFSSFFPAPLANWRASCPSAKSVLPNQHQLRRQNACPRRALPAHLASSWKSNFFALVLDPSRKTKLTSLPPANATSARVPARLELLLRAKQPPQPQEESGCGSGSSAHTRRA